MSTRGNSFSPFLRRLPSFIRPPSNISCLPVCPLVALLSFSAKTRTPCGNMSALSPLTFPYFFLRHLSVAILPTRFLLLAGFGSASEIHLHAQFKQRETGRLMIEIPADRPPLSLPLARVTSGLFSISLQSTILSPLTLFSRDPMIFALVSVHSPGH